MPSPLGSTKERGAGRHGLWTAACRASSERRERRRAAGMSASEGLFEIAGHELTNGGSTSASSQRQGAAARSWQLDLPAETGRHPPERRQRVLEHPPAMRLEAEVLVRRPPRSLVGSPTKDEDVPFDLESLERFVDRTQRDDAAGALLDFLPYRHAVGIVTQPEQRQQHELFEIAERREVRHRFVRRCLTNPGSEGKRRSAIRAIKTACSIPQAYAQVFQF